MTLETANEPDDDGRKEENGDSRSIFSLNFLKCQRIFNNKNSYVNEKVRNSEQKQWSCIIYFLCKKKS